MNERGRNRFGAYRDVGEEELVCPKPRRAAIGVCSATVEMLKPVRRLRSHASLPVEGEAGYEILDILLSKGNAGDAGNPSCSLPYFCGSPPSRAGNPLIHDVHFTQKRVPPPPVLVPQKSSCGSSFGANPPFKKSSYGSNPTVLIEGFACSASDSHRGVPALG